MYFSCAGERLVKPRLRYKFKSLIMIKKCLRIMSHWVSSNHLILSHLVQFTFFPINNSSLDLIIWRKNRSPTYSTRFLLIFRANSTNGHQKTIKLQLPTAADWLLLKILLKKLRFKYLIPNQRIIKTLKRLMSLPRRK